MLLAAVSIALAGVQPHLASNGERVYLVFGQGDTIHVSRSLDAGDTFDTPSVLPVSGRLSLGMRRGPRVAATDRAVLVYASPGGAVCECCHPSVAIGGAGDVAIMFRNNLDGNRDMYVTRSTDAVTFAPATKLGTGSWALNACPMDGGAIGFDGRDVVSTWRREDRVYLSTAATPERQLGTGRDSVVSLARNHRDVAWSAAEGVMLLRGDASPLSLGRGRFPAIIALPDRTVIAWEQQGQVMVQAVRR